MKELWKKFELASLPYRARISADQFDYAVNISLQYRYLYVETPKAACSSIKATLQKIELGQPDFAHKNFQDVHNRYFSPLLRASQVGDLNAYFERKDIFTFCFVRNPYTRVLSAYLDKIANVNTEIGNDMQFKQKILVSLGYDASDVSREVSFPDFVRAISQQPYSVMDPHWRIQYYHTFQDHIRYNKVGRFEQFDSDFQSILEQLNIEDVSAYYESEIRHSTKADLQLARYYTDDACESIYNTYRLDFDHFGYPKTLPI